MGADDGPVIGQTGARFGGAGRRRGPRVEPQDGPIESPAELPAAELPPAGLEPAGPEQAGPEPDGPVVGLTGARFGGPARRRRSASPPPSAAAPPATSPASPPGATTGAAAHASGAPEPPGPSAPSLASPVGAVSLSSFVRPYVLTSGRTRAAVDLPVEALVSALPAATHESGAHRDILDLCRAPRSVAEIAALRGIPLGVARVLVGDLAAAGAVAVHRTAGSDGPDLALMERVLSGLRRL